MHFDDGLARDRTDLDCASCGNECVTVDDGTATCPNCGESYSLVVRDGFAILEASGWAARITVEPGSGIPN